MQFKVTILYFEHRPNFCLHTGGWGIALPANVAVLLDNVVTHFYRYLDPELLPVIPVHIKHDSFKQQPWNQPSIHGYPTHDEIFIKVTDTFWGQYAYQFSHELCHHVIGIYGNNPVDSFGWFEESLCELASLYTLNQMAATWESEPPYPGWASYAGSLKCYANTIILAPRPVSIPFWEWLEDNIAYLYQDRYLRGTNKVIAIRLLPLFLADPELWKTIQYLKRIKIDKEMSLMVFLEKWETCLPEPLQPKLNAVRIRLTGSTTG